MATIFWGCSISVAFLSVLVVAAYVRRILAFANLKCPHCGGRYGLAAARRSRQVMFHVVYEGWCWPRWGVREENVRGTTCHRCEQYAVFNGYGERYKELES
jgi:hypothetical protein